MLIQLNHRHKTTFNFLDIHGFLSFSIYTGLIHLPRYRVCSTKHSFLACSFKIAESDWQSKCQSQSSSVFTGTLTYFFYFYKTADTQNFHFLKWIFRQCHRQVTDKQEKKKPINCFSVKHFLKSHTMITSTYLLIDMAFQQIITKHLFQNVYHQF